MEGRECDCPEWVERCAHFNGRVAVLATNFRKPGCPNPRALTQYAVATFREAPLYPCYCGCGNRYWTPNTPGSGDPTNWSRGSKSPPFTGDDHDEALRAFYAAEERLLREGIAS